ncbi:MAG: GntR family transcriptional regulator [Pseudomonadota bacterium]
MSTPSASQLLRQYSADVLDPDSPTPLYHQLYTMLRDCIVGGVLKDGERMPSEKELAESFNVSRITARRALHDLATRNLVARHRGRGTFVSYRYRPEPFNAPLLGVLENLELMGRATTIKVLGLHFIHPPADLAERFKLERNDKLCQIFRVRSARSMPFAYYETWTRGLTKGSITRKDLVRHPRLELLRKAGIRIDRIEQTLSAKAAAPEEADALGVMPGKPLLKLVRHSYDADEKQVDYLYAVYNPDRFQYHMTLAPDGQAQSKAVPG